MNLELLSARLRALPRWQLALIFALLGFVVVLPSLGLGVAALDDAAQRFFIRAHLHREPWVALRPWYDIYNLCPGDPTVAVLERFNWMRPWWAWPGLKVRFFRPLAAASLYFDYAVFGDHHWLAHLHSALWYAATCFSISLMLQRLTRNWAAALIASLLFVWDDAHASPASWLAGRNALIAATFVGLSMIGYDAAARAGRRWAGTASIACLACALLAAENVVSALPWFLAYAVFMDARRPVLRVAALGSVLATVASWLLLHHALGFGTRGSGAYLDPIFDSRAYFAALPARYGMLVHAQLAAPWQLSGVVPFGLLQGIEWAENNLLLPALVVFVARNADRDRELAFWSVAGVLGLLPLTAADPHERLLTHGGVALWMVVAHFLVAVWRSSARARGLWRVIGLAAIASVLVVHALLSPVALALAASPPRTAPGAHFTAQALLDHDAQWRYRDLVFVNVPSLLTLLVFASERVRRKLPLAARMTALGATANEVEVTRLDERSFEIYSPAGYLQDTFSSFWRGPSVPLRQGERVRMRGVDVQVIRLTPDLRPLRIRFRFGVPLEDPTLKFVYWAHTDFRFFSFGKIGQRMVLPADFDTSDQQEESLVR